MSWLCSVDLSKPLCTLLTLGGRRDQVTRSVMKGMDTGSLLFSITSLAYYPLYRTLPSCITRHHHHHLRGKEWRRSEQSWVQQKQPRHQRSCARTHSSRPCDHGPCSDGNKTRKADDRSDRQKEPTTYLHSRDWIFFTYLKDERGSDSKTITNSKETIRSHGELLGNTRAHLGIFFILPSN